VLLDASLPQWQTAFFDNDSAAPDLLQKVLTGKRNSKVFAG
jgi:hypothetical protein